MSIMTIKVKDWNKFQHFKDRKPPWIKLYRDLLDDLEWHELDPLAAKALVAIWLIASENDGELPEMKKLAFRLRVTEKQAISIVSQLDHWLIQDDINLISDRYQSDSLEIETETYSKETETYSKEEETETRERRPRSASSAEFDEFWSVYPKRIGRGLAERAWIKALTFAPASEITSVARSYPWNSDPQFIPHPATWLNQRRWQDDLTPPQTKLEGTAERIMRWAEEIEDERKVSIESNSNAIGLLPFRQG